MDDDWGYPHDYGKLHIFCGLLAVLHFLLCLTCQHLRKSFSERNQRLGSDSAVKSARVARWCFSGQNPRWKSKQDGIYKYTRYYKIMFILLLSVSMSINNTHYNKINKTEHDPPSPPQCVQLSAGPLQRAPRPAPLACWSAPSAKCWENPWKSVIIRIISIISSKKRDQKSKTSDLKSWLSCACIINWMTSVTQWSMFAKRASPE